MLSLWQQRKRTCERKKQSEGKIATIVGGRRMEKRSYRSSSSSSDLQEGPEKSICPAVAVLNLRVRCCTASIWTARVTRKKLCQRCHREILGEPGPEPELDLDEHLHRSSGGFCELTPWNSTSSWPSGGSMVVSFGSVVYILGGRISNTATNIGWLLSPDVSYFETNSPEKG
ncbi:hypothetical protein LOK49_LG01G03466 [Camellia lanceoleosa]|uniref:Uncharacterized protein n=1 Tax=Camellia lanceoleosa TaxID=1840588 RepID=A0ACC0J222_9ERIC|nr:hypothetical protein LOK49_LG01G03466 [Camellia lanceoleosa]